MDSRVLVICSFLTIAQAELLIVGSGVTVPGKTERFFCISTSFQNTEIRTVQWLVDGAEVSSEMVLVLQTSSLEHSVTTIRCEANTTFGRMSASHVLRLQGLLSAVTNLTLVVQNFFTAIFTWTPPVTLDIPNNDPDITYCIDVHNSTFTHFSECNITRPQFTYIMLPPGSWCSQCCNTFTITPVNIVGNGMSSSLHYAFQQPHLEETLMLECSNCTEDETSPIGFLMSAPVCDAELRFVDVDTGEIIILKDTDVTIAETNVTFSTQQLRKDRNYSVTVTASNIAGNATFYEKISTHDTRELLASIDYGFMERLSVTLSIAYSDCPCAAGVLIVFVLVSDSRCVGFTYLTLSRTSSQSYTLPFQLLPGQYRVLVYDIESDGTLATGVGYPAVNTSWLITDCTTDQGAVIQQNFSAVTNCRVTTSFAFIVAKCTYTIDTTATGFQVIAQLINSSEVRRLYVNKTTDRQTSVSVQVEQNGLYQVTIFPISGVRGIVDSTAEYSDSVMVLRDNDILPTTTIAVDTTVKSITIPAMDCCGKSILISLGACFGITSLLSVVLAVVVVAQCFKLRSAPRDEAQIKLNEVEESTIVPDVSTRVDAELYEEIKEPEKQTAPQMVSTQVPTTIPQYEDVNLIKGDLKSSDLYHLTQCSAYGISLN